MNVLIIGGTGLISREIVKQLVNRGDHVTVINRGKSGRSRLSEVENLVCDRNDTDRLELLVSGRVYDAVIDMICFTEDQARTTVRLFSERCAQLMIVSSVAAYQRPLRCVPSRESSELLWTEPGYRYGFEKAQIERYLNGEIANGASITVVRPSLTFGPGARNVGVLRQNRGIVERIKNKKPLVMFGDGTNPWSFSFSPDIAAAMIALLANDDALQKTFHIASPELSTWNDLYRTMGNIVGSQPDIVYLPSDWLYAASPEHFAHVYFEKSHPGVFDCSELFAAVRGFSFTYVLRRGLEEVIESWIQDSVEVDLHLDALEDRLAIAALGAKRGLRYYIG